MDLERIQTALRDAHLDGWLFYDHHGRDPLAYSILGLPPAVHVTRRWYYLIPAHGTPRKLVHRIESGRLDTLPGDKHEYSSWQELEQNLATILEGTTNLALQYSPRNAIMYISMVDAGTVELLRDLGKQIHSSADLVATFQAVLSPAQIDTHFAAQRKLDGIVAAVWPEIRSRITADGQTDEYSIVLWLQQAMRREGLVWEHGPNVSAGQNSADSHYDPTPASSRPIRDGDFLLLDIWGRLEEPDSIWYDITWTGVVGREPTTREQEVFAAVRDARDASIQAVTTAFASGQPLAGWQADDAARSLLTGRGFGSAFTHRTGHNIATDLHGAGAHLDNLETHDERRILPQTCFSVEPGAYFPGTFGVRSEVNMITYPDRAVVTGALQTDLVRI